MSNVFWSMVCWVIAASGIGFTISAVFSGWLKLSRRRFLIPYISIISIFLFSFIILNRVDVASILADNWIWGILAGGLLSIYLVKRVKAQSATRQVDGAELAFDMAWAGFVYGMVDALFLNIMPVIAVWMGTAQFAWTASLMGKVVVGFIALVASLLVTLTYHLGYPEFRNRSVGMVLIGNSLITLGFLLSGSPFGSLISHTAMHLAAVLQGPETTIQLPPHYQA